MRSRHWFFLVGVLATNLALAGDPLFRALLAAQAVFYGVSAVVAVVPVPVRVLRPLLLTAMFTGMNLALLVGFWRWARGVRGGTWVRTVRPA